MSAFIVSREDLDLLLTAAVAWGLTTPEQADETGRMLWKENLTSVAHRYPADHDGGRPGPVDFRDSDVDTYRFQCHPGQIDPEAVADAADSLAYQSCEHPSWAASAAYRWVTYLREQATERTTQGAARKRRVEMFAAKFAADTIRQEPPRYVEPTDTALSVAFAGCVRPPAADLYDEIRAAFAALVAERPTAVAPFVSGWSAVPAQV
jgi:hypothetical protein